MTKLRMGMVGGGPGAFIGDIHRRAAAMDGEIELVCGAFSSDPKRSTEAGKKLGLPADRVYANYQEMMMAEVRREQDRMDFVAIVTPNDSHHAIASSALDNGFHVFLEKPATMTLDEAKELADRLDKSGLQFGLAHTYIGYPMVQEARQQVSRGAIGEITRVLVEYTQGWLTETNDDPSIWRLDPARAGASCAMGDIGVHAANMAEFVSGLPIDQVLADLVSVGDGRQLDDDGAVLLKFRGTARGVLVASQVCTGEENNLALKVYGNKGGLEWRQQEPNTLLLKYNDKPNQTLRTGLPYLGGGANAFTRTPSGHPEGYIEAFANLYRAFTADVRADGAEWRTQVDVPGMPEALRGMAFIEAVVNSSQTGNVWRQVS